MVSASNIPKYLYVSFGPSILMTWFGCSFPSVMYRLPLFIASMMHFSMPNSILISWLYILTVWGFFRLSFYPPVHFLRMWLSGIMVIANTDDDSASPRNMPLWIFNSVKLWNPVVHSTLQVCMVFSINCTIWLGILYMLRQCSIQLWATIL